MTVEDLIADESVVVTLSHGGYAKAQPLSDYRAQRRGGRGKSATAMKDEDFVDKLFIASMHELPVASRGSRGRPIVNLLPLEENERVNAVLTVRDYSPDKFVLFATSKGVVKKTALADFSRPRTNGIIAIDLRVDDYLIDVALTEGESDVMLFSSGGRSMRFHESNVRTMGRTAAGVRGIRMPEEDAVIGLIVVGDGDILTATVNGYGKRTAAADYPTKGRGGLGVIDIKTSERNGRVIGAVQVSDEDQIMLITNAGTLVRTNVGEISVLGRNTQGVRLIRLSEGEELVEVAAIDETDANQSEELQAAEELAAQEEAAEQNSELSDGSDDADTAQGESKSDQSESDDSPDSISSDKPDESSSDINDENNE